MKIFEFLMVVSFLLAGAASENNLGIAFILVFVSFICGWLSIPKKGRKR